MRIDILTIFPSLFDSFLGESLLAKAIEKKIVDVRIHDLRNWSRDRHRKVDDAPFGGGAGMVMTPQPIADALEELTKEGAAKKILLTPRGGLFTQAKARELSKTDRIILVCGRYEGVDERIGRHYVDEEISIGDYILSGGEVAAMALVESLFRLLPGAIGKKESLETESFEEGLLEYPQYTRPEEFGGERVPEILLSGHHEKIKKWRREKALEVTRRVRPDLWEKRIGQKSGGGYNESSSRQAAKYPVSLHQNKSSPFPRAGTAQREVAQNEASETGNAEFTRAKRSESAGGVLQGKPPLNPLLEKEGKAMKVGNHAAARLSSTLSAQTEGSSPKSSREELQVNFSIALVHDPVVGKSGETMVSSITTLDIHDMARIGKTYGARAVYIVTPVRDQKLMVERIKGHWLDDEALRKARRVAALSLINVVPSVEDAAADAGKRAKIVKLLATSAAGDAGSITPSGFAAAAGGADEWIIMFGTAYGLAPELLEKADCLLAPVLGRGEFNHLPVRAASAIILDRLFGS